MTAYVQWLRQQARSVNWILLAFLLLLLNVKLVVKLAAFLLILITRHRAVIKENILRKKFLYFYLTMIIISVINLVLASNKSVPQLMATGLGIFLWTLCLLAALFLHHIVAHEKSDKLFQTLSFFFILHAVVIFFNLGMIMIECGTLNPYTFKGINQKYYISTGDYISGVTFDSPVTTALISCFGVIFFLYRKQYFLSLLSMTGLVLIASNLTNILLVAVLLLLFVVKSDSVQKSVIVLQLVILVLFIGKISPQNTEYTGRFVYKILGWTYDKPKNKITPDYIRKQPDSTLGEQDRKRKLALEYIDSISAERVLHHTDDHTGGLPTIDLPDKNVFTHKPGNTISTSFKETPAVKEKVYRFTTFLHEHYDSVERKNLSSGISHTLPGKWIATKQIISFFKQHPHRIILGTGTGNYSSRVAFKTTGLGIAGGYPAKYRYIHPWFRENHLFLYLHYHAQEQNKHAAENTPDSTYGQIISEYGLAGVLVFLLFYLGYFIKHRKAFTYSLGILLLLLGSFFTDYWFEQLSVVILSELLLFLDIKSSQEKKPGV